MGKKHIQNRVSEISRISCTKCTDYLEKRSHKNITSVELNRPFYYNRWYYCKGCKRIQNFEEDKVFKNKGESQYMKAKQELLILDNEYINKMGEN